MARASRLLGLRAEVHGPQAEPGDFQAGAAQMRVAHEAFLSVLTSSALTHAGYLRKQAGACRRPLRRLASALQAEPELDGDLPVGDLRRFRGGRGFP